MTADDALARTSNPIRRSSNSQQSNHTRWNMPKRSGAESMAGGSGSHRGGAGRAGAGAQSGAGDSKKNQGGRKKSATKGNKKAA
jgi:hypothetical protein